MNGIKQILLAIIGVLFLTTCQKIETLKRDNPLDANGDGGGSGAGGGTIIDGVALKFNSYSVYSDNNGDKNVNPGETVQMKISLKNTGSSAAKGVMATFSTESSHISNFSPITQINYGDISSNTVKWADYTGGNSQYETYLDYTIKFTVANTTPTGTPITISISIVDENDNMWTDSFDVPVVATNAKIGFNKYTVYSDNNGDKNVNPGETIQMKISLKNTGSSAAKGVMATFSTESSHISNFSPITQINYGDISSNTVKWADYTGSNSQYETYLDYTIKFTVANTTPTGTPITISISIVDESDNMWTDTFDIPVVATNAKIGFNTYTVYSDNNGDKNVNPGETVQLKISLKNTGSSAAKGVMATFSTGSSYISNFSPITQINYGDISSNTVKWADYTGYNSQYETYLDYTVKFTVSNSTPTGTQITINISIVDESNNTWTDTFDIPVVATNAKIGFNKYTVYFDSNNNKIVNPGETIQLKISLKNTGSSAAKGVMATFSTGSSYISNFSPTTQINYGDISSNTVKWADYTGYNSQYETYLDYTIKFTVSNSTPTGTQIPISISIVDESDNTWSDSFNVPVQ